MSLYFFSADHIINLRMTHNLILNPEHVYRLFGMITAPHGHHEAEFLRLNLFKIGSKLTTATGLLPCAQSQGCCLPSQP